MSKLTLTVAVVCSLLITLSPQLSAQATDGNLVGAVQDASGAAIAGSRIQLVSVTTGITRAAATDSSGLYRYNNLPAGAYTLSAAATGFSAAKLEGITIELNKTTTASIVLQVGAVSTQNEVTEAPVLIDTTTAQITS